MKARRTGPRFPAFFLCAAAEEADVKKANTYREYAADCRRIAQLMSAKDKDVLLTMAQAWEDRALEAERHEKEAGRER
jgi:hypothetical protein